MAVCNLFSELTNNSGNFLMFSQYVEDITRGFSEGDNYKVIPTKFIAFNINYSDIKIPSTGDLNKDIPNFFQNHLENAAAYNRKNETELNSVWKPTVFKNLFWNYMFNHEFLHPNKFDTNEQWYVDELMYINNINMHSYNEHKGMGYGEIYCYIPTNAKRNMCEVLINNDFVSNIISSDYLEGFEGNDEFKRSTEDKNISFNRNNDYNIEINNLQTIPLDDNLEKYNINTIVILYSIYKKQNDEWILYNDYQDIPMGIYFTGKFNSNNELSNTVLKYIDTNYETGTAYGLRICTRFTATSNGKLINNEIEITDSTQNSNLCQLMTSMSENLSQMLEITKSNISISQEYKDSLTKIINNRNNIPYVRRIGDEDYWFVNGKLACPTKIYINKPIDHITIKELNYEFNWNGITDKYSFSWNK